MGNRKQWNRWRKYGKGKFIFFYALFWDIGMVIFTILIRKFLDGDWTFTLIDTLADFLPRFICFYIFGLFTAFYTWNHNEKEYQKYVNEQTI